MKLPTREYTSKLYFVFDELTPPIIRDSYLFWLATKVYKHLKPNRDTDMSTTITETVLSNIQGETVLEVGCGNGELTTHLITEGYTAIGVDIQPPEGINFRYGDAVALPFPNKFFDTVICVNTLEHIPAINRAIFELFRVAKKRVIIVIPRQRPYLFTFDEHIHFFPYPKELISAIHPNNLYFCEDMGQREILYIEDINDI